MKKLLWIGDAGVPSGFARATHEILDTLRQTYEVTVLGINYQGDPHGYPYDIYAAAAGGDAMGVGRLPWMCEKFQPDVIVVQQDGWFIPYYVNALRQRLPNGEFAYPEHATIPIVAAVAVDGMNFRGQWLDGVAHAIFWTQFALDEARKGGYKGPATVIPLGVDLGIYYEADKTEVRRRVLPRVLWTKFLVGNVNRNQSRKRWDLTVRYFAKWLQESGVRDAYLFIHSAPTGDECFDVNQLAKYYGVLDRLAYVKLKTFYGKTEDGMRDTYNCLDLQISTTQGEGFGLTTFEGMACGVPQIVPSFGALEELCEGAARLVPCTSSCIGAPYVNVVGGVADEEHFVRSLQRMYESQEMRETHRTAGLARVEEPRFRWKDIGQRYADVLQTLEAHKITEAEWADLGRPAEVAV